MQKPQVLQADKEQRERLLANSPLHSYPRYTSTRNFPHSHPPTPLAITDNFHEFTPTQRPQMKYHYQLVSKSKVRIELIPEDKAETKLLKTLTQTDNEKNEQILAYFNIGLEAYSQGATPTKIAFMQFPKVALCSFESNKTQSPLAKIVEVL
ncbi:MAG: hypothetical protein ACQUHE_06275 [Bacteroidia bacterium]